MDVNEFKIWLDANTSFTKETKSNVLSRLKRADTILQIKNEKVYLFNLSQEKDFQVLTVSIKSQVRRAVKLYFQYIDWKDGITNETSKES
jgi:DNA (cytosine-5)-methyltransferase 1